MRHRDLMWEEMNYNFKWTKQLKLGTRGSACHNVLTKQGTWLPQRTMTLTLEQAALMN